GRDGAGGGGRHRGGRRRLDRIDGGDRGQRGQGRAVHVHADDRDDAGVGAQQDDVAPAVEPRVPGDVDRGDRRGDLRVGGGQEVAEPGQPQHPDPGTDVGPPERGGRGGAAGQVAGVLRHI